MANQSVPALSNTKKLLEILELLGLGDLRLEIWLNFWEKNSDLTLDDVARFLGQEIKGTVTFSPAEVGISINEGVPLTTTSPNLNICQDLRDLAGHFTKEAQKSASRQSRWNLLRFLRRNK